MHIGPANVVYSLDNVHGVHRQHSINITLTLSLFVDCFHCIIKKKKKKEGRKSLFLLSQHYFDIIGSSISQVFHGTRLFPLERAANRKLGLERSRGEKEEAILDEPIRQAFLNKAARKRADDSPSWSMYICFSLLELSRFFVR